jgi:cytochrome c553
MKYTFIAIAFIILVFVAGCNRKDDTKAQPQKAATADKSAKPEKTEFKMYEMSQMAALMEQMYVDNQRLKERIISGDTIGTFPKHILNIHTSVMTDEDDNDAFFREQAAKFIKAQQLIYSDPANAKQHYNDAVSSCVQCHEGKCEGPIPRIKKLYIK